MSRRVFTFLAIVAMVFAIMAPVGAASRPERASAPDHVLDLKLSAPITDQTLDASLTGVSGQQRVIVRLAGSSVADTKAAGKAAKAEKSRVVAEQGDFLARVRAIAPEAKVIARVQHVLNAVFLEVDAASLPKLAADPSVTRIVPVTDYELDLSETVPYIGASTVQAEGYDGSGVKVAVLDSGIDYTHAAFGGSGDPADFAANDPDVIETGTFPTAKVVGGYDFVGSDWVGGPGSPPEAPDADPLDDGSEGGHGTHVGHIIGGVGGVAPGVDLYAVKVCSSESTSCSGIALIQGMEFAVDPNGDGDISDAVDIINMSLGSNYGQPFDDDLSLAVDNASAMGVLTVASAGNAADKPFIVGTPSATSSALSVAQTQVPSAALQLIDVPGAGSYPAVFQPWSVPLEKAISAPGQYGDGAGGNRNGCAPFTPDSLAGKIVLVDRGTCAFTLKIKNVGAAGGLIGIIGLVAPGAPFSGGDSGDRPIDIPAYMISQADSSALKAGISGGGITITVDPAKQLPLVGQMVGSSSRGPQLQDVIIKPEIGAPGASVSAIAGSGTLEGPFGGTSGAAPMVAGSAALLLQSAPGLSPAEAKARLVNTGDTDIDTDPFTGLAPVTRIGGGEVRADAAVNTPLAAWDDKSLLPTLSFGFVDVDKDVKLHKKVRVANYSDEKVTLDITPTFRYENDAASGAVEVKVPEDVKVDPGKSKTFDVEITIHGDLLYGNYMNSGSNGANPAVLDLNEFDGYLMLDGGDGMSIHVPWHVLPRKAAEVKIEGPKDVKFKDAVGKIKLKNHGVGTAQIDAYSLLYVSPNQPEGTRGGNSPVPDLRAVGINTFLDNGCAAGFIWAFAINTWERQTMAVAAPAYYSVFLDIDQDGTDDYEVFNFDFSLSNSLSDGRNLVWTADLNTGAADAFFFTEHSTVTGNTMMYICGEQVGLTADDILNTNVDMTVVAWDWYFTGSPTDVMGPFTVTPYGEQYVAATSDLGYEEKADVTIVDYSLFPGNTPEAGILLVTNGDRGAGARGGATAGTEALIIPSKDFKKEVKKVLKAK